MKFLRGETLVSVSSSPNSGLEFSYSFRKGFHGNKRIHLVQHALGQWFCPTESTNQLRPTCPSTISRCFFTASSSTSNILNIHSSPTSPASCKSLLPAFARPSELSFSRWYFDCDLALITPASGSLSLVDNKPLIAHRLSKCCRLLIAFLHKSWLRQRR